MCLLEALDHLWVALAEAEVCIIGRSVLIMHEASTSDEFGLGWKAEVPLYEEDEDEDKITVELDEHGPLDSVVAMSHIIKHFEENHEDKAEEDDSPLFPCSHSP
ncbi:hypothetical protein BKA82DRAFT_32579 [Pisolithus tinctorius]|uniref:Uncharacterized protein n=1 Tax=Pisolithus tinctorius Marx 270 TaxID=870435 RepID=A0A0C3JHN5_PISTI|nr:hypothetical protein BKA82DRAFT_32579 [Pisolithus tinctorius]KIN97116.1 hypothetical protein M404DRAFT_32579 [Pisolithus tinctorius Marx 270]